MVPVIGWRPVAAYFYLLHLDGPGLAWEYLRRNSSYLESWRGQSSCRTAQPWGLRWLEDPALDARLAQPAWATDPTDLTRLTMDAPAGVDRFSLWALPGRKRLSHDGSRLLVTSGAAGHNLRMAIDGSIHDGVPFAYLISANSAASKRWRAIERQRQILAQGSNTTAFGTPDRIALMHMRSIQAIDGHRAGASQRAIAEALFGVDTVIQRWQQDGELRAQVRHLLRQAEAHIQGQYLKLLNCH